MTITFSPVRQTPEILEVFLRHVEGQLWVYDDNVDPESSALLRESDALILPKIDLPEGGYGRDGSTHEWQAPAVSRVAQIKNYAIDRFMQTGEPWMFLLDSDVILQPGTVNAQNSTITNRKGDLLMEQPPGFAAAQGGRGIARI